MKHLIAIVCLLCLSTPAIAAEKLQFRILAVALSDDDGKNRANIKPSEIDVWIARSNHTFLEADVEFLFKPNDGDFIEHRSTLLNRMELSEGGLTPAEREAARKFAAQYPTKIVVFFRHGPNKNPFQSGFASHGGLIAVAGFEDTKRCGQQYRSILAHELGHYFGLPHPHQSVFNTVAEAEKWLRAMESAGKAIDGDKIEDTPPTPFIWKRQCGDDPELTLNGKYYRIPRSNVMSYYQSNESSRNFKTITPGQAAIVRREAVKIAAKMKKAGKKK